MRACTYGLHAAAIKCREKLEATSVTTKAASSFSRLMAAANQTSGVVPAVPTACGGVMVVVRFKAEGRYIQRVVFSSLSVKFSKVRTIRDLKVSSPQGHEATTWYL